MMATRGAVFLSIWAFAWASPINILKVQTEDGPTESFEDLTIKMPDAIAEDTHDALASERKLLEDQETELRALANRESSVKASFVQNEKIQSKLSHMLENGVVHSELKPIVQNKVKKVMSFLQTIQETYSQSSYDKKKEFLKMAETLIMQNSGTRSFNKELCNLLWSESTEVAGQLSSYFCPTISYPSQALKTEAPPVKSLQLEPPSRERSAYLAQHFWNSLLSGNKKQVIDMLSDKVCYYAGSDQQCGKQFVQQQLPYIGFPFDSKMSSPEQWHCDTTTCITPIRAWAKQQNYCMTTWGPDGKVTEVIVPVDLWR